jgi:hypothetical protein
MLLQHAAASAAAKLKHATSSTSRHSGGSSSSYHGPSSFHSASATERLELYMAEKAKADKAAADLLAELDEEEEQKKSKMSKKQRKKQRQQQAAKKDEAPSLDSPARSTTVKTQAGDDNELEIGDDDNEVLFMEGSGDKRVASFPKPKPTEDCSYPRDLNVSAAPPNAQEAKVDPMEEELEKLIEDEDIEGIEALLVSVKGVPGLALLRKNAKKALKRLRAETVEYSDELENAAVSNGRAEEEAKVEPASTAKSAGLAKLRKPSTSATENVSRAEWSMPVEPSIVGYVIGKGGLRIRELMEESGARIWVDQEGLGPNEQRMVCCSGQRKNVDTAMKLIVEVVEKAPSTLGLAKPSTPGVASGVDGSKLTHGAPGAMDTGHGVKPRRKDTGEQRESAKISHVLTCDPRFVPLLIGRRGWTIKNIQDSSGARVDIDQTVNPRRITITGSESSVEIAGRMVRDVLSYPHSQLQGTPPKEDEDEDAVQSSQPVANPPAPLKPVEVAQDELPVVLDNLKPVEVTLAEAITRGAHSPPSSLIMTGDAKSTVSASSSLSSTPEPSMASSLPKGGYSQIPPGPMLPPSFGLSPQYVPVIGESPPQQKSSSLFVSPETQFGLQLGPSDPLLSQVTLHASPIAQPRDVIEMSSVRGPPLSHGQSSVTFPQSPGGFVASLSAPRGSLMNPPSGGYPDHSGQGFPSYPHGPLVTDQAGHWNGIASQPPGSALASLEHPSSSPRPSDGFHFDAAVDFLQSTSPSPSASLPTPENPVLRPSVPPQGDERIIGLNPKPVLSGFLSSSAAPDDSHIVDSLFGPSTGAGTEGSVLLNGLSGLSINPGLSGSGLWGDAPSIVEEKALSGLGSILPSDMPRSSPANLDFGVGQAVDIHHPPQSRFGW